LVKHTPEEHDKVHPDAKESARHEPVVNCIENRVLILQRSLFFHQFFFFSLKKILQHSDTTITRVSNC
jgi:hypothetical protein